MNAFMQQLEDDLNEVFFNTEEFAEIFHIHYDGEVYKNIPVIVDTEEAKNKKGGSGKAQDIEEIYTIDALAFIHFKDLGMIPRKNHEIIFENTQSGAGKMYTITTSTEENGLISLGLMEYDE